MPNHLCVLMHIAAYIGGGAMALIGLFAGAQTAWALSNPPTATGIVGTGTTEVSVMQIAPAAAATSTSAHPAAARTGDLAQTGAANPATFIVIAGLGSCLLFAATSDTASENIQ